MLGNRFFCTGLVFIGLVSLLQAAEPIPRTLQNVGFNEKIKNKLDLEQTFTDSSGKNIKLKHFFNKDKAIVLNLAYYNCPMLCHLVAQGVSTTLSKSQMKIGDKFDVVTISIDPKDTLDSAKRFKEKYISNHNMTQDWHFLLGDEKTIKSLTETVGFNYNYNAKTNQFSHAAGIIVLSPTGIISRYLYGIDYTSKDFNLSIAEARKNNSISTVERVLLFCYNYDPQSKKYVLFATRFMKLGGILTVLGILLLLIKVKKNGH